MDMLAAPDRFAAQPASQETPVRSGTPSSPVALVLLPVPQGRVRELRKGLDALARSCGAGDLPAAPGSLAVLILAAGPEALAVAEDMAPGYPFPLRVEEGAADAAHAVRRAAAWAASLGAPGVPLLLAPPGRPVAPRWAYGLLATLRDGADVVACRAGVWGRFRAGARMPSALSGRAQAAVEAWGRGGGRGRPGAGWTGRDSPWCHPGAAGLHAVPT